MHNGEHNTIGGKTSKVVTFGVFTYRQQAIDSMKMYMKLTLEMKLTSGATSTLVAEMYVARK